MAPTPVKNILLTGRPGIGKTTVIMRLRELVANRDMAGFYTEEIRGDGQRLGFQIVTMSGKSGTLAHVNILSRQRVGKYGVDVVGFEKLALPELATPCDLVLIDEIGKMECFSDAFVDAVQRLLDGSTPVVATVASQGAGFIADVKARTDIELIEVTLGNRDGLPPSIAEQFPK